MFTPELGHFFWNLSGAQTRLLNKINNEGGTILVFKKRQVGFTTLLANYAIMSNMVKPRSAMMFCRSYQQRMRLHKLHNEPVKNNCECLYPKTFANDSYQLRGTKCETIILDECYDKDYDLALHGYDCKNLIISCDAGSSYLDGLASSNDFFRRAWNSAPRFQRLVMER